MNTDLEKLIEEAKRELPYHYRWEQLGDDKTLEEFLEDKMREAYKKGLIQGSRDTQEIVLKDDLGWPGIGEFINHTCEICSYPVFNGSKHNH